MTAIPPEGDRGLMVCPNSICHTLNRDTDAVCLHCGLPLTWTKQLALFRPVLAASRVWQQPEVWQVELHVQAEWPGGSAATQLVSQRDDRLNWLLPSGKRLSLTVQPDCESAVVICDQDNQTLPIPCGAHELVDGLKLSARYIVVARSPMQSAPRPQQICSQSVPKAVEVTIGRCTEVDVSLADATVELRHAVIITQTSDYQPQPRRWIADCGSEHGTFVNRRRVLSKQLEPGDFVQIGPFAWVYSEEEGRLLAEDPIKGVDVRLCKAVASSGQMKPLNSTIRSGEFVAITGEKGSGKSTLMKILSGMPGARASGELLIGERGPDERDNWWSADERRAEFLSLLGFVTQKSIVHEQLQPVQIVAYSASLRGASRDRNEITTLLHKFGLSDDVCKNAFRKLSGGEKQLVRTAAELVSRPAILLLDEPDSGLDRKNRRKLLKHLRRVSYLGCTVIVITHGSETLAELAGDEFDRVIRIEKRTVGDVTKGEITLDEQLAASVKTQSAIADPDCFTDAASHGLTPPVGQPQRPIQRVGGRAQCWQLLRREFDLACSIRLFARDLVQKCVPQKLRAVVDTIGSVIGWGWLDVPVRPLATVIVAVVFATSLAVAVPQNEVDLLGFLSVISVLWMSSSLSLLEIVGEREVFDHEHHLFLKVRAYLGAKLTSNLVLAVLQTVVFFATLVVMREWLPGEISCFKAMAKLPTSLMSGMLLVLMSISAIGTALGLAISALANHRKELASFILPLVMIGQIVFSVSIAQKDVSRDSLFKAYGKFNLQRCPCDNWVESWEPLTFKRPAQTAMSSQPSTEHQESPTYRKRFGLCQRCFELVNEAKREERTSVISSVDDLFAEIKDRIPTSRHNHSTAPAKFWPDRIAAALSYVTISRHGDVVLRGMNSCDDQPVDREVIDKWTYKSCFFLAGEFIVLILSTAIILRWQAHGRNSFAKAKNVTRNRCP